MLVLLNPCAGGGTAQRKWETLGKLFPGATPLLVNGADLRRPIREALHRGEHAFIAAGGDGTMNLLLNLLLSQMSAEHRRTVTLGAVGLGSSNDFHKPFRNMLGGIPLTIDRNHAYRRDVGLLELERDGQALSRYFLVNASVGATAAANAFFNGGDRLLRILKRLHTPSAILYTAIRSLVFYENFPARISCESAGEIKAEITNLGILKSPHVSGSLLFDGEPAYASGTLEVRLAHSMGQRELFAMLLALVRHRAVAGRKAQSWTTRKIAISSTQPFDVEYDGEVLRTSRLRVSILPKHLRVCS